MTLKLDNALKNGKQNTTIIFIICSEYSTGKPIVLSKFREKMSEFNAGRRRWPSSEQVRGSRLRGTLAPAFSPGRVHADDENGQKADDASARDPPKGRGRWQIGVAADPGQRSRPTPGTPARTERDLPGRSRRPQRPSVGSAAASSRDCYSGRLPLLTGAVSLHRAILESRRMSERNKKKNTNEQSAIYQSNSFVE